MGVSLGEREVDDFVQGRGSGGSDPNKKIPRTWKSALFYFRQFYPFLCTHCGERMKVIAFLTEYAVVDRIICHLQLTFAAEKPPPYHVLCEIVLMAPRRTGSMNSG